MRYLVTGCAGFVGSHLVDSLLRDGHEVIGIDCFTDYYDPARKRANLQAAMDHDSFTLVERNLASDQLDDVTEGVDGVFHLAAQAGVRASWGREFATYCDCNVLATQRLLESVVARGAATSKLPRVVYASSSSVYGEAMSRPTVETALPAPVSPYGVTKLAAEHLCDTYHHNHGLPRVSLRYFTVFGERQRPDMAFNKFISAIQAGRPITVFGDGHQSRDFTYVGDIVAANRLAMDAGDEVQGTFNIGGGTTATVREVIAVLDDLAGSPVDVSYGETQPGDVRHTSADTSRARAMLGFAPQVDLREGIRREFEWIHSS